jgi:hypothetical protein
MERTQCRCLNGDGCTLYSGVRVSGDDGQWSCFRVETSVQWGVYERRGCAAYWEFTYVRGWRVMSGVFGVYTLQQGVYI